MAIILHLSINLTYITMKTMDSLEALQKVNELTIKETIDLLIEIRDSMPDGDKKDYHDKLSNDFGKLCFYLMDIV